MHSNQTAISYFIIKGISDVPEIQIAIFFMVLIIYLITLCGNMIIFLLICLDHHLHTPMYSFLGNLSVVDMSSSTISLHNILTSFVTHDKVVPYNACIMQTYMFGSLTGHELLILTAMSYDRYVAICNPLRYHVVMNTRTCTLLVSACWLMGFAQAIPPIGVLYSYTCFSSNVIDHFFCDIVPLTKLVCNDTTLLELLFFLEGIFLLNLTPFILTFISYIFIIITIMKLKTSYERRKAFYTCSSHLTVVVLLYTTLVSQYMNPDLRSNLESKKLFALFNTAAVPVLNPLIYSLKNKDVKRAIKRSLGKFKQIL